MQEHDATKKLVLLANFASDWWWEMDAELRFTHFSEGFTVVFGSPASVAIGKRRTEFSRPDDDNPAWRAHLDDLANRRPFRDFKTAFVDVNGVSRPVSIGGTPLFDADGAFTGYIGVGDDLTALGDQEREAVERAAVQESILDNIDQGLVLIDENLKIVTYNRRVAEFLGIGPGQFMRGDSYEEIVRYLADRGEYAPEEKEAAISTRLRIVRSRERFVSERRRPDGRVVEVIFNPRPAGGGTMTYSDVTEIRAREAQLLHSQKMEAVGRLIEGMAEDFSNKLSMMLVDIDALRKDTDLDPRLESRMERIDETAQAVTELIHPLLAFSRRQQLQPQDTNLNDMVAATGKLMRHTLGEQIEVDALLADELWSTEVDRTQLEAALVNLCVNARDAMPRGGLLRIETRNVTLSAGYVALNPDAIAGEYVGLSVTDTGTGIGPEILPRVFDPFFTTKRTGKGSGLGLSMVYGFIKQSMGHIRIHSKPREGTTVTMYLPRSKDLPVGRRKKSDGPLPRGNERILVVDDDDQVCALVSQQLESLGYEVKRAGGGAEGLAELEVLQTYDLLLTDVVMPWPMNGKDLADEVARRWPQTKVLFMSGYAESSIFNHGLLDAGVQLLAKPFRRTDLALAVRKVLDHTSISS
jgi:PAS domain S-box-containing protein